MMRWSQATRLMAMKVRLQLLRETNVVEILWRQEGEETLIGAWVDEDDDAR